MCVQIFFTDDEEYCETVGDLRNRVGRVFPDIRYDRLEDEQCLCSVDIDKTLANAGYSFKFDSCMDYRATKK